MGEKPTPLKATESLYGQIRGNIEVACWKVYHMTNFAMVRAYWQTGKLNVEEEQRGKEKANLLSGKLILLILFLLTPIVSQAQRIEFKKIIEENKVDKNYTYKDSVDGDSSSLQYLGHVRIKNEKLHLINHEYYFPTAAGSIRKNRRFWVMTTDKSLGYYMLVSSRDSLPIKVANNRYLIFDSSYWGLRKVDFRQKFPGCFFDPKRMCFAKWRFNLKEEPTKTWITAGIKNDDD